MIENWGPWVVDCLRLLDADGAYARFRHGVDLSKEPAVDMQILDNIRAEWNKLRSKDMAPKGKTGGK